MRKLGTEKYALRFLAAHYILSILLLLLIQPQVAGGWFIAGSISYLFAALVFTPGLNSLLKIWPEAAQSQLWTHALAAFILLSSLFIFILFLDNRFSHISFFMAVAGIAVIPACWLAPLRLK